ncbi:MAG TPA: menaquinone biosynthesis protein [Candidatus Acidoferrum sp.]
MSKLRISIVEYLNTAPLVWGFTHGAQRGKYDLSFTVPSQCAEALRTGAADIAIIPAIEYQRIEGLVVLPGMAIASRERVRSLLIIAKTPMERARRVALDKSSRSTQALTRILCADRWKIAPEFVDAAPDATEMLRGADAAMLIGDPALRLAIALDGAGAKRAASGGWICSGERVGIAGVETIYVYDVVEEWRRLTGLPAVLAIWATRKNALTAEMTRDFAESRDYGLARIAEICGEAAGELSLPAAALETYLRENIDFSLSTENCKGLEFYFARAAELGLIAEAKPIRWACEQSQKVEGSEALTSGKQRV